jgi:hypothetical protein
MILLKQNMHIYDKSYRIFRIVTKSYQCGYFHFIHNYSSRHKYPELYHNM